VTNRRFSLDVVSPPRPEQVGAVAPREVVLSEPMRRFACNQKGCCCSGWDIPFRLEDFLRLHDKLPEEERKGLTKGIQLVMEEPKAGEQVLHSLKLDGVGDDRACRFLEAQGSCGVHARLGISALPDLCVDFPAFGFRRDDGAVELWFDPVCPEVLEQLDESDAPLRLSSQPGFFGDPGMDLRVSHSADRISGRVGKFKLEQDAVEHIRGACLDALADRDRPLWRTLAALLHAFRRLRPGNERAFEIVEPEDPAPFLRFLGNAIAAHGADLLGATFLRYKRFVWSIDPLPICERSADLIAHLADWQPAYGKWLAPQEDALRPLMLRYLAHRFATPTVKSRGELKEAADSIAHIYALSLRYAAALGATLEKPVDREIYKAALGTAEFFYRSLHLPREALPWFARPD